MKKHFISTCFNLFFRVGCLAFSIAPLESQNAGKAGNKMNKSINIFRVYSKSCATSDNATSSDSTVDNAVLACLLTLQSSAAFKNIIIPELTDLGADQFASLKPVGICEL